MTLDEVTKKYLEFKSTIWSPATLKTETARLNQVLPILQKIGVFDPAAVFRALQDAGKKPYTITTTIVRLSDLEAWAYENGFLPGNTKPQFSDFYRRYLRQYRQRAYVRKAPKDSYLEASQKIAKISCPETRRFATILLETGVRFFEGAQVKKDAAIKGKGGFERQAFNVPSNVTLGGLSGIGYRTFLETLKREAGLKPHDLRKIAAGRLVEAGFKIHEVQTVMGWRNLETARSYLVVKDLKQLEGKLR